MKDILEIAKPQLDAMKEIYAAAYKAGLEEGRRQVFTEISKDLKEIKETF